MKPQLGKIKKIELREAWSVEPNFTRWLAAEGNLAELGEELGLDLELIQTEADVGDFNVDILAEEVGTGFKVIIENQLEITDHDHLGKLLTYASGHGARYIIWIFKEIRDEHRQAIDWLNEHTDDDVNFFAVKLELWSIAESTPAPKFDVVCRPNEWTKIVRRQSSQGKPSEGKLRQLEFWTRLRSYAQENRPDTRLQSPLPQHWTNISFGTSQAHIALSMRMRDAKISCELYIPDNKALFSYLHEHKLEIEKELGATLEWIEAAKATRIVEATTGFNIEDESSYTKHFEWLLNRAGLFKKVFAEQIRAFGQSKT